MNIVETIGAFTTIMWGMTAFFGVLYTVFIKKLIGWERVWYSQHQWDEWMPPVFATVIALSGFVLCLLVFLK